MPRRELSGAGRILGIIWDRTSKESSASSAPETARPSDTPHDAAHELRRERRRERHRERRRERARQPRACFARQVCSVCITASDSAPPTPRTPKLTKPTSIPTKPEPFRFDSGARDGALTSLPPSRTHCMRSPSIACGALHAEPEHCMLTHCMRSPSAQALAAWSADVLVAAAKRTSSSSPRAISHAISPEISHRSSPARPARIVDRN